MNNGRRYSEEIKERARTLRKDGLTHREIAKELGTSWSIVFLWTKEIILTSEQKKAIHQRWYKKYLRKLPHFREKLQELARVNLARYQKRGFSREELLQKIREFYSRYGRIPLKREFNLYETYQRKFGSWNNAIRAAGFESNQVIFSKKFMAKDDHICDSFAEKIIDDWLSKNNVEHERNVLYSDRKMTADFAIGNVRIEYFGLQGLNKIYDQIIKRKQKLCQREGLKLIEIYPSDLFSKNFKSCLRDILKKLTK